MLRQQAVNGKHSKDYKARLQSVLRELQAALAALGYHALGDIVALIQVLVNFYDNTDCGEHPHDSHLDSTSVVRWRMKNVVQD